MQGDNLEIADKKENGALLFNTLLNKVHKGNMEEMYDYFIKVNPNVYCYGDSKDKQLLNYCIYKREAVINMYKSK